MARVVFALILIACLIPAASLVYAPHGLSFIFASLYSISITLIVGIPITVLHIKLNLKLWQLLLAGAIIAICLNIPKLETNTLVVTAIISSTYAFILWVLAFWRNPAFSNVVRKNYK